MKSAYFDTIGLIERLHRYFLEVLKSAIDRRAILDINNVQALILYNIGNDELTVGELTARGYYLGSNVSYNLKKMVENGYLIQERSTHDRRSVRVRLTEKGRKFHTTLAALFEQQVKNIGRVNLDEAQLASSNESLKRLERFWLNAVQFDLV
jgi:DNA-binding MarR family transcriptional regulator